MLLRSTANRQQHTLMAKCAHRSSAARTPRTHSGLDGAQPAQSTAATLKQSPIPPALDPINSMYSTASKDNMHVHTRRAGGKPGPHKRRESWWKHCDGAKTRSVEWKQEIKKKEEICTRYTLLHVPRILNVVVRHPRTMNLRQCTMTTLPSWHAAFGGSTPSSQVLNPGRLACIIRTHPSQDGSAGCAL